MPAIACVKKALSVVTLGVLFTSSAFANESFSIMNDRLSSALQDNANNNNASTQTRVSKAYNDAKGAIGGPMDNSNALASAPSTSTTDPHTSLSVTNLTNAQTDKINNAFGQTYIDAKNETSTSTVVHDTTMQSLKIDPTGNPVSMVSGVKNDPTGTPVSMVAGVKNDPTGTPVSMVSGVKNDPTGTPVSIVAEVKNDPTGTPVSIVAEVKNDPTGTPVTMVAGVKNDPTGVPVNQPTINTTLEPVGSPINRVNEVVNNPVDSPVAVATKPANSSINVNANQLMPDTVVQVGDAMTTAGAIAATNPTAQISVPTESVFDVPVRSNHNVQTHNLHASGDKGRGAENAHSHAFGGHGYGHDNSKSEGFGGHSHFH
ncbi:hypothetical protein [Pseudescherichia sp.]|uniref:hypothetical protein n=1 Tax=Pseudescherichia sp. TaxID=2055881 RepID=UPI0028A217CC|nr:hypothetical protein [Pseudescherichia sp.]